MDNKSKYELVKFALSLQKNLTLDEWKGLVKSANMEKQAAVPIALWILGAAMAGWGAYDVVTEVAKAKRGEDWSGMKVTLGALSAVPGVGWLGRGARVGQVGLTAAKASYRAQRANKARSALSKLWQAGRHGTSTANRVMQGHRYGKSALTAAPDGANLFGAGKGLSSLWGGRSAADKAVKAWQTGKGSSKHMKDMYTWMQTHPLAYMGIPMGTYAAIDKTDQVLDTGILNDTKAEVAAGELGALEHAFRFGEHSDYHSDNIPNPPNVFHTEKFLRETIAERFPDANPDVVDQFLSKHPYVDPKTLAADDPFKIAMDAYHDNQGGAIADVVDQDGDGVPDIQQGGGDQPPPGGGGQPPPGGDQGSWLSSPWTWGAGLATAGLGTYALTRPGSTPPPSPEELEKRRKKKKKKNSLGMLS